MHKWIGVLASEALICFTGGGFETLEWDAMDRGLGALQDTGIRTWAARFNPPTRGVELVYRNEDFQRYRGIWDMSAV